MKEKIMTEDKIGSSSREGILDKLQKNLLIKTKNSSMVVPKVCWQLFKVYPAWRMKMYLGMPVGWLEV